MYFRKKLIRILTSVIGLAVLAGLAAWQFYVFVVFRDANGVVDVQGGTVHLWLAIGIAFITSIAGFFLISNFLRYDQRDEMHITSHGTP